MKYHYKIYTLISILFVLGVLINLNSASTAQAESIPAREATRAEICSRIDDIESKMQDSMSSRQQALEKRRSDQSKKMQSNFENKALQISELRSQWDKNRSSHYEKLGEKATTQEQKSALEDFKNTIESAVAKRRAAFDQATQDYRNSIDYTMNNKQNGIEEIVSTYKSQIIQAQQQLNTDCQQSKSELEIRQSFNSRLQQAKNSLTNDQVGVDQIALQINQAKQNRLNIIEAATQEFKSTLESAKASLKSVLQQ